MKNEGLPQVDAWQRGPVIPHVSRVHPDSPPVSRRPERLYTVVCRGGVRFDAGAAGSGRRGRSVRIGTTREPPDGSFRPRMGVCRTRMSRAAPTVAALR